MLLKQHLLHLLHHHQAAKRRAEGGKGGNKGKKLGDSELEEEKERSPEGLALLVVVEVVNRTEQTGYTVASFNQLIIRDWLFVVPLQDAEGRELWAVGVKLLMS